MPDVENSTAEHCYLTKYDYGNRFEDNVGRTLRYFFVTIVHCVQFVSLSARFSNGQVLDMWDDLMLLLR